MSTEQNQNLFYINEYDENNLACLRVCGELKFNKIVSANLTDEKQIIIEQFNDILKDIDSLSFHIPSLNVILSNEKLYYQNNIVTKTLFNQSNNIEAIENNLRKNVPVFVMRQLTNTKDTDVISPLFTNFKGICRWQMYNIPIDLIVFINPDVELKEIYSIIIEKLNLHLGLVKQCYLLYYKNQKKFVAQTYHFRVDYDSKLFITVVYPNNKSDTELKTLRENIHNALELPLDRPFFRREDVFEFVEKNKCESNNSTYIQNIHDYVKPSGVKDGKQSLVKGNYLYYHYLQDGFNDNGWGCAYRSFQTIFSWFKLQSYTNQTVPTHKQIQDELFRMGDKTKEFVGSSNWIGSMEISFCLSKMLGVESKILNLSSGGQIVEKVRELQYHFDNEGTPIMIGGNYLAHTIIGIDFNESTGDVKFLVLDPHYTGSDDIKSIVNKGWCGWKDAKFWNESVYYNLCLPLRAKVF